MLVTEVDVQTLRSELNGAAAGEVLSIDPSQSQQGGRRTARDSSNGWSKGVGVPLRLRDLSEPVPKGDSVLSWPG
jgi:hypothetical protein